jgi:hypothetical protein
MSVTLLSRGYIVQYFQIMDTVSPYPGVPSVPNDVEVAAAQDSIPVSGQIEAAAAKPVDESVKVTSSEDSATIRIIPCGGD